VEEPRNDVDEVRKPTVIAIQVGNSRLEDDA
jgi:hypothetical protein